MSTPISSSGSAGTTSDTSSATGYDPNQFGEKAFLQLLIAELKNQDPNKPMDGQAMITQLAQLNQTQATMQSLTFQQETFASSVIGKTVTGTVGGKHLSGTATNFAVDGSTVTLTVAGQAMNITNVSGVGDATTSGGTSTTTTG